MTDVIHGKENSTTSKSADSNEGNNDSILPSKNPLLYNAIIADHLLGFLPLDDLKQVRLVCKEWCSTAAVHLRKRTTVNFRHNGVLPLFMGVSEYCHPNLPFQAFVFSSDKSIKNPSWPISEIEDFFEKRENIIREVTFDYVTLTNKCNLENKEVFLPNYNLTSLFINPSNITSLKIIHSAVYEQTTNFEISLERFVSIKSLYLSDCKIIVSVEKQSTRIAPLNIDFRDVSFIQNGDLLSNFHYNDVVDFRKAVNINLTQNSVDHVTFFDMGQQVLNANQLHLEKVSLKNWAQAKGYVQLLSLGEVPFEEKNKLVIKQLRFDDSKINLTFLPQSLEFLDLLSDGIEIIRTASFQLPNLKYLGINMDYRNSLRYFSNCPNLKEIEIHNSNDTDDHTYTFSVGWLPNSVQRLRMEISQIKLTDNCVFELDSLILDGASRVMDYVPITEQFKAKLLVVDLDSADEIDTDDIALLVKINNQAKQILIASDSDLHEIIPFAGSQLSKCVDKESNVYQFENGVGKSITKKEFKRFFKRNDYFPKHFNDKANMMNIGMQIAMIANHGNGLIDG